MRIIDSRGCGVIVFFILGLLWAISTRPLLAQTYSNAADDANANTLLTVNDTELQPLTTRSSLVATEAPREKVHALFLGDSVTRYGFISLAYFLHTRKVDMPEFLFNDKKSKDWTQFFRRVTTVFDGNMSCDCHRVPREKCNRKAPGLCGYKTSHTTHENRQYRHPSLPLVLSFMQVWGDIPMHATVHPSQLHTGTIADMLRSQTYKMSLQEVIEKIVPQLVPNVTHIVLNIGHWKHAKSLANIENILKALSAAAPVSIWRETTPRNYPWDNPPRYPNFHDVDVKAKALCRPVGHLACDYFPFPFNISAMKDSDWWDSSHFNAEMNQRFMAPLWDRIVKTSSFVRGGSPQLPVYPPFPDRT